MSNTTATLRRKIDGAEDLRSVVRPMKAVAASSIGQYENSVRALGDYYQSVKLGLGACLRAETQLNPVAEKKQRTHSIDAVVFGSDQGMVGQFNDTVSDFAFKKLSELPGKSRIWAVGERVHSRLVDSGLPVLALFELPTSVRGIVPLVGQILVESQNRPDRDEDAELYLFYNRPRNAAVYSPIAQRLLPLDQEWLRELVENDWPSGRYSEVFGDRTATLRALLNEYLFVSIFRACAESLASENASRLAAMQRADENIDELLKGLNGSFHRLRKERIDEELFDVIAAFDSLQGEDGRSQS
jgi:F-type H+-transporting ATPase subunit gamma